MRKLVFGLLLLVLLSQNNAKAADPFYTGWATSGLKTNPILGTVLAQTPPLGAGAHRIGFLITGTGAIIAKFQRWDITGAVVVPYTHTIQMIANAPFIFAPPSLPIYTSDQETLVLITGAAVVGDVQGSIFYE